ncbi:MAG: hypothetical protein MUO67_10395 [Anaerolineales bacterium]|nr:hypothetical protein [Anaerolineales bacterium]
MVKSQAQQEGEILCGKGECCLAACSEPNGQKHTAWLSAQPSRVQFGLGGFWPGFVAIRMHAIVGSFPSIALLFETNKTSIDIHYLSAVACCIDNIISYL